MEISRSTKKLSLWTVLLGVLPFVIYAVERALGKLPSATDWYKGGTNHGPWRWELEGFTILYPVMILAVITAIKSIAEGQERKKWQPVLIGGGLIVLQAVILYAQLVVLNWTVN